MVRIKYRYLLLNILYPVTDSSRPTSDTPDYLKFHAPTPEHVSNHVFLAHVRSHISAAYGDHGLGVSMSSLKLVYFSHATSTVILRVPRAHHQIVWAALSFMSDMPAPKGRNLAGPKCVIKVVRVSGTIRKAEEELLRRARKSIVQAKLAAGDNTRVLSGTLTASYHHNALMSGLDEPDDDHSSVFDIEDGSDSE